MNANRICVLSVPICENLWESFCLSPKVAGALGKNARLESSIATLNAADQSQ